MYFLLSHLLRMFPISCHTVKYVKKFTIFDSLQQSYWLHYSDWFQFGTNFEQFTNPVWLYDPPTCILSNVENLSSCYPWTMNIAKCHFIDGMDLCIPSKGPCYIALSLYIKICVIQNAFIAKLMMYDSRQNCENVSLCCIPASSQWWRR